MSAYEQRLTHDKDEIRQRVAAVGQRVEQAIAGAVAALLEQDRNRCYRTVLGDLPINREIRAIDRLCHTFVARHLPSAGHLRFVSSVLRMTVALERIGDYAVTIAREGAQLGSAVPGPVAGEVRQLADQACAILADALLAFSTRDAELARKTRPRAKSVERTYGHLYKDLTQQAETLEVADAFALLAVFHRLERVSDQAKNISEETLFELTGETKPATRYRILFVDEDGTTLAPLAVALARKAFPESGTYDAAACQPKGSPASALEALAANMSLDLADVKVSPFPENSAGLEGYHVVVVLDPCAAKRIEVPPYATSLLHWRLDGGANTNLESLSRALSSEIRDLMVLMRGDDAP